MTHHELCCATTEVLVFTYLALKDVTEDEIDWFGSVAILLLSFWDGIAHLQRAHPRHADVAVREFTGSSASHACTPSLAPVSCCSSVERSSAVGAPRVLMLWNSCSHAWDARVQLCSGFKALDDAWCGALSRGV